MPSPITTMRFQVDRDVYLNTMWRHGLSQLMVRVCVLLAFFSVLMYETDTPLPYIGAMVVFVLVFGLVTRYQVARKAVFHPMNSGGFGTRVLEFTPEDVRLTASNGIESKIPWKAFVMAERRGEFVLLYMNLQHAYIVPDVAFATPQDRDAFLSLVESSVPWRGKHKLRDIG